MKVGRTGIGLLWLILVLLASCRREEVPVPETSPEETAAVIPQRIVAQSSADRLRVRSLPYLDEEIVTYLSAGESVVVESRTEWTQILDSMNFPWYFVRTEVVSGWTYGGFLIFSGNDALAVPVNPALPKPEKITASESEGPLNPADLPEILLPVFGMEGEPPAWPGAEGTIGYDPVSEYLILPVQPLGASGLAALSRNEGTLRLVAEHTSGQRFERTFSYPDISLYSSTWGYQPSNEPGEAVLLPFYRLASLREGSWEFYAFAGNENWPAAVGQAKLSPGEVSILPVEKPNPMADSPRSIYRPGDKAYCFGKTAAQAGYRQVALYHDTEEYKDGMVLLKPEMGRNVKVDANGKWQTVFVLDAGIPEGRYWVAVGDPIEGLENLKLFVTSLTIRR